MIDLKPIENEIKRAQGFCYHSDAEIIARIEELIKENTK